MCEGVAAVFIYITYIFFRFSKFTTGSYPNFTTESEFSVFKSLNGKGTTCVDYRKCAFISGPQVWYYMEVGPSRLTSLHPEYPYTSWRIWHKLLGTTSSLRKPVFSHNDRALYHFFRWFFRYEFVAFFAMLWRVLLVHGIEVQLRRKTEVGLSVMYVLKCKFRNKF